MRIKEIESEDALFMVFWVAFAVVLIVLIGAITLVNLKGG